MEACLLHIKNIGIEQGNIIPFEIAEDSLDPLRVPQIQRIHIPQQPGFQCTRRAKLNCRVFPDGIRNALRNAGR
jgi:hypothetical protein